MNQRDAGGFGGLCERGHDVSTGARFCSECGAPAHAPSVPPDGPRGDGLRVDGLRSDGPEVGGLRGDGPEVAAGQTAAVWYGWQWMPVPVWGPPPAGRGGAWSGPGGGWPGSGWSGPGGGWPGPGAGWSGPSGGWPGGRPYWAAPAVRGSTSAAGLGVLALLCSVLWFCWLGSVAGVVLGHIALRRIRRQPQPGRAVAVAGLVLGYLSLGALLIVLLAAAAQAPF